MLKHICSYLSSVRIVNTIDSINRNCDRLNPTIFYLKREIRRITLIGAALLAFITVVPNFIESTLNITSLNGLSTTSVLILGGVVLDLKREISNIYYSEVYNSRY